MQKSCPHPHHTRGNGTSPTSPKSRHNQQHHCTGSNNGYNDAKGIQIEWLMVQLVKMPQRTVPIQISLAKRYSQSSWLCQQTPPGTTPPNRPPILRLRQQPIACTVTNQQASSLTTWEGVLNTHISELDTQLYPSIPKWPLTYPSSQLTLLLRNYRDEHNNTHY